MQRSDFKNTYVLDVLVRLVIMGLGSDKLRLGVRFGDSDGDGEFEDIVETEFFFRKKLNKMRQWTFKIFFGYREITFMFWMKEKEKNGRLQADTMKKPTDGAAS